MSSNTAVGSNLMNQLFTSNLLVGKKTVSYDQTIASNDATSYVIGYNPNDFIYTKVDSSVMPTDCNTNTVWDLKNPVQDATCDKTSVTNKDKGMFCYQRELCKNQYFAQEVMSLTDGHNDASARYLDIATQTNFQAISVANLTVGVALMLYTMFSYW